MSISSKYHQYIPEKTKRDQHDQYFLQILIVPILKSPVSLLTIRNWACKQILLEFFCLLTTIFVFLNSFYLFSQSETVHASNGVNDSGLLFSSHYHIFFSHFFFFPLTYRNWACKQFSECSWRSWPFSQTAGVRRVSESLPLSFT